MNRDLERKFKLGIFVSMGILFLILGIYFIGKDQNIFRSTITLSTTFKDIQGLQPGNEVRYLGINIGTVKRIGILDDSTIQVDMVVSTYARKFIKVNAVAELGRNGLMGDRLVNIIPGKKKSDPINNNDFISSYNPIEAEEMLQTLDNSNQNIEKITSELYNMILQAKGGKGSLGVLLTDTLMSSELKIAVTNVRIASDKASAVVKSLDDILNDIKSGEGSMGKVLSDTLMGEELEATLFNLRETTAKTSALANDLSTVINKINRGKGAAGTVISDTTFANNLKETMISLKEGTEGFNQNMEALKHNFLFRKYFKKKAKEKKDLYERKEQVYK